MSDCFVCGAPVASDAAARAHLNDALEMERALRTHFIDALEKERALAFGDACATCKGHGEYPRVPGDPRVMVTCRKCGGTGRRG